MVKETTTEADQRAEAGLNLDLSSIKQTREDALYAGKKGTGKENVLRNDIKNLQSQPCSP